MSSQYFNEDVVKSQMSYFQLFRRLWPYCMRYKLYFFSVVTSMVCLVVAARLLPTLIGKAIDNGILKNHMDVVIQIAIMYLCLEVARAFFTFLHSYLFRKMGNRILFEIRERLIQHVQSLPTVFFDKTPTGRIVTRLTNDVVSMGDLFTEGLISVFTNILSVVAVFISMLLISPRLTFFTAILSPVMLWLTFFLSHKIQSILRDSKKKLATINAFVAENLNGMKVLQLHNRTSKNENVFQLYSKEYKDLQLKTVHLYAMLWPVFTLFYACALSIALYLGGALRHEGALAVGSLIAFIMHVQDFFPPMRSIMEKYQQFQNSLTGAERIFTLLSEQPEDFSGIRLSNARLRGHIEFRKLNFSYDPQLPQVLHDISFRIRPGESVAIVGRTGSGKSTVISLLQRFYDYRSGEILIEGIPLRQIDKRDLRSRVAVVQQDPFTFRGTIYDNITLFNPALTQKTVESATRKAYAWDLVQRLGGLESQIQERGANLSVGERQLLAFARILAFDPDILILDEATANIDSQNEYLIQQATREITKGRTSIIIAHRLSTILDCDRILVLDQGRLMEQGSHRELLALNGIYAKLYATQFSGASSPEFVFSS